MPKLTSACAGKRSSNKENLCNGDEVLYFQQNLFEQQSQERGGKKGRSGVRKKPSAKWFAELAKAFRIMPSSTLLIEVWKVLHRVYEVQTKRKQTLLPSIALKELIHEVI